MKNASKTPRIFYHPIPLEHQATFTLVNVFHEVQEFDRNYTLPFNMLSINIRAEGADASVLTNLKTGEIFCARENDITFTPCNLPQNYRHTTRSERYAIHFKLELYPGVDVFSGLDAQINVHSSALRREADETASWAEAVRAHTAKPVVVH